MISVGTVGLGLEDFATPTLSHELAERMSDAMEDGSGVNTTLPSTFPNSLKTDVGNQIGDGEAATNNQIHYSYRLGGEGGVEVQPYWSAQSYPSSSGGAFIVDDGNLQQVALNPDWDMSDPSNPSFNGTYDLTIDGDQLGPVWGAYNDNIAVTSAADGELQVNLNGEMFYFDPNTIHSITINPGAGQNTVSVENTTVPVTINDTSNDTVNVSGATTGGLNLTGLSFSTDPASILGATLAGVSGASAPAVTINDSGGSTINLTDEPKWDVAVSATGTPPQINLNNAAVELQRTAGPTTITLASGINFIDVQREITYVNGTPMDNLQGQLNIASTNGTGYLVIDDSKSEGIPGIILSQPHYTVTANTVSWDDTLSFPVVNESFDPSASIAFNGPQGSGLLGIGILGGKSSTTFKVELPAVPFWNPPPPTLSINGNSGSDTLILDDSAAQQLPSSVSRKINFTASGDTINWKDIVSAPALPVLTNVLALTYSGVKEVDLIGGKSSTNFAIDFPATLSSLAPYLNVKGNSGSDTLTVDDTATANVSAPVQNTQLAFTVNANNILWSDLIRIATVQLPLSAHFGYSNVAGLTIDGSNIGTTYTVQSTAAGTPVTLNGGSGNDTFAMNAPASALPGRVTINGGGGSNTLDYSAYKGNVGVDLPMGSATNIAGGIANIQNVVGSQGNDILVGNGGNVLTGGTGRNILIAGKTTSTLIGGSGEDILVGGTTRYDTNGRSLEAIMAEWTRADRPYAARVKDLLSGGGLNGKRLLNVAAFQSNGGGNTLTGNAGLDLFYGLLPSDSSTPDTTDWNAAQGEIFIDPNGQNVGVRIDATKISAPTLILDGKQTISDSAVQWVTLQPGTHTLTAPAGYGGEVAFTVGTDDKISYTSDLNGILSGQGTNQLTVNGVALTINAQAVTAPNLMVDYYSEKSNSAPFTVHLLPGLHALATPAGYGGGVVFTVGTDDKISYTSDLNGILSGQGTNQLTVNGVAVTINAQGLMAPELAVDYYTSEATAKPFTVYLLPGLHLLSGSSGSVTFTVNPDGTISFPASEDNLLALQGSTGLIVKALS